jgi:hypothetical protein
MVERRRASIVERANPGETADPAGSRAGILRGDGGRREKARSVERASIEGWIVLRLPAKARRWSRRRRSTRRDRR